MCSGAHGFFVEWCWREIALLFGIPTHAAAEAPSTNQSGHAPRAHGAHAKAAAKPPQATADGRSLSSLDGVGADEAEGAHGSGAHREPSLPSAVPPMDVSLAEDEDAGANAYEDAGLATSMPAAERLQLTFYPAQVSGALCCTPSILGHCNITEMCPVCFAEFYSESSPSPAIQPQDLR